MAHSHGIKWTEEKMIVKLKEVITALGIDRMPSRKEIESITKDSALTNRIAKNGGFYHWASVLGLECKQCETSKGKQYETICEFEIQNNCDVECERMTTKFPFDILAGSFVKIDVKVGQRYYYTKTGYYHTFNLEKNPGTCDIYVCYCLDTIGEIEKTLVIPAYKLQKTQLSIGVSSAYDIYNNAWHWINKYNEFYKTL